MVPLITAPWQRISNVGRYAFGRVQPARRTVVRCGKPEGLSSRPGDRSTASGAGVRLRISDMVHR